MSSAPSEMAFPISYQEHFGEFNQGLRGEGIFAIRSAEPRFSFKGKARRLFGPSTELHYRSEQIVNVSVDGRKVRFYLHPEKPGAKDVVFVFYGVSPAEARNAAECLPRTISPGVEGESMHTPFAEKLAQLPSAKRPWTSVTNLIIAANVAVFAVMGWFGAGWFETASMKPYVLFGANNGGATTDGEWWRLVTCMFVHFGAIHLALNMWALFQAGHFVEKLLGRSLFTLAYFGSGIVASFATLFWHGDKVWSAGASGAVFGVYGMLLGFTLRERQSIPKPVLRPMMNSALGFAGYNLFYGMIVPQIDNAAHIGGLVAGTVLGWLLAMPVENETRSKLWPSRFGLGAAALAVVIGCGVMLSPRFDYRFKGGNKMGAG